MDNYEQTVPDTRRSCRNGNSTNSITPTSPTRSFVGSPLASFLLFELWMSRKDNDEGSFERGEKRKGCPRQNKTCEQGAESERLFVRASRTTDKLGQRNVPDASPSAKPPEDRWSEFQFLMIVSLYDEVKSHTRRSSKVPPQPERDRGVCMWIAVHTPHAMHMPSTKRGYSSLGGHRSQLGPGLHFQCHKNRLSAAAAYGFNYRFVLLPST